MIILHAGFFDHQLWLWGEAPAGTATEASARRGRRIPPKARKRDRLRERLPFDAGGDGLLAALDEVVSGLKMGKDDVKTATIWLPAVEGQPVASSPLIAEPPPSGGKAVIAPWAVAAIPLNTAEAVDLLCRCVNRETLAAGVIVGSDLAFWAAAMRLGGTMTAREQFLPAVEPVENFYRARWEPVFAGAESQRLQRLAKTMPQACRALTAAGAEAAPETPMSAAVESFIGEVVDYLVRSGSAPKKVSSVESAHDQWLSALQSSDGVMEGSAAKMAELAAQTREWRRPIMISAAAPFRLCFRLEEPEEATGRQGDGETGRKEKIAPSPRRPVAPSQDWHVRYLLQAADDPSLLIPVAGAWEAKGRVATALKRGKFEPREYLLSALGQASGLSPHIERSLKTATPGGYDLDAAGAHDFLTKKAWLLEHARERQKSEVAGRQRADARPDNRIRLAGRARRRGVVARRASGAGQTQIAAGPISRPVGTVERGRDSSRARFLEEEGDRQGRDARRRADGSGAREDARRIGLRRRNCGRLDRRLPRSTRRPQRFRRTARSRRVSRRIAAVSNARLFVARFFEALGTGRMPGRRYGTW